MPNQDAKTAKEIERQKVEVAIQAARMTTDDETGAPANEKGTQSI